MNADDDMIGNVYLWLLALTVGVSLGRGDWFTAAIGAGMFALEARRPWRKAR